jgi:hypothetical protein
MMRHKVLITWYYFELAIVVKLFVFIKQLKIGIK